MLDTNTSGARRGDGLTTARAGTEKHKFKVTVNNAGEILTFYTTTTSVNNAKRNAIYQLADKLGRNPQGLMMQLRDRATVALAGI
jgi:hypothetical protein